MNHSLSTNKMPNNQLVNAPAVLGRLHFARSSLRTAPQQKRYESLGEI
jgi:hypothetical protein